MKKTAKNLMLGAAALATTTAITATTTAQEAHADVVSSAPSTFATPVTHSVTSASTELNAAQAALTSASTASTLAHSNVNSASAKVASDQAAVSDAQKAASFAASTKSQATSANIVKASDAVNSDQKAVALASTVASQAHTVASSASAKASATDSSVKAQQSAVNAAADTVTSTQSAYNALIPNTAANQAYQKALVANETAQKNLKDAKDKQAQAKNQLDNSKNASQKAYDNLVAKQKVQQAAQDALEKAPNIDPSAALKAAGLTVTATDQAKDVAQKINNGTTWTNLSKQDQLDLLTGVTFTYTPTDSDQKDVIGDAFNKNGSWNLSTMYTQLTKPEQQVAVNQFIALALDGARAALGLKTGPVLVHPDLIKLSAGQYHKDSNHQMDNADKAGIDPNADNQLSIHQGESGYPISGVKNGHKANGGRLDTTIKRGWPVHIDQDNKFDIATNITMANLKSELIKNLSDIFIDAKNYDDLLLGTFLGTTSTSQTDPTYIGYAPDETGQDNLIVAVNGSTIKDSTKINADSAYENVLAGKDNNLDQLTKTLQKATGEVKAAQDAQKQAEIDYKNAAHDLENADKNFNEVQRTAANTTADLQKAQVAKEQADKNVKPADQAKIKAAQDALTKAQNDLKDVQTKLNNLKDQQTKDQAAAKDAQAKADQADADSKKAQDQLKNDQTKLSDLQNAQTNLDKANAALKAAQDQLTIDQAALTKAQADAKTADDNLAAAQKAYDDAQVAYKKASDHQNANNIVNGKGTIIDGNQGITSGDVTNGHYMVPKGVSPTTVKPGQVATINSNNVKIANSQSSNETKSEKTLPQTGNQNNETVASAGLGIATLAAMFGFVKVEKKKTR